MERARAGTDAVLEPVSDDELAAQSPRSRRRSCGALPTSPTSRSAGSSRTSAARHPPRCPPRRLRGVPARRRTDRASRLCARNRCVRTRTTYASASSTCSSTSTWTPQRARTAWFRVRARRAERAPVAGVNAQALQLRSGRSYPVPSSSNPDRAPHGPDEIHVSGGTSPSAQSHEPWAYDNELEAHETELRPFVIDRAPVTNGQFAEFVDGRGYRATSTGAPQAWSGASARATGRRSTGKEDRRLGARALRRARATPAEGAVQHVSSYEAEAYAHWAGGGSRPRSSGSAPPAGTTTKGSSGTRGDRRGWASRRASTVALLPRSRRLVRGRRQPGRLRADGGRRLGVDVVRIPAVPRLRRVPLPGVLRGELRRRRSRPPRRLLGDGRARRSHIVPPLGASCAARDLRGLPLRPRRLVADLRLDVGGEALGERLHHLELNARVLLEHATEVRPA